MLRSASAHWRPTVVTLSAVAGTGIDAFWGEIARFRKVMTESGELAAKRSARPWIGCGRSLTAAFAPGSGNTPKSGMAWR